MGDWDAPAPFYVYTCSGLVLTEFGLVSSAQWNWSLVVTALLLVHAVLILRFVYRPAKRQNDHQACLERTYYLEKDLGIPITVPVPAQERAKRAVSTKHEFDKYCRACAKIGTVRQWS